MNVEIYKINPAAPDGDHPTLQSANTELDHTLPIIFNGNWVTSQSTNKVKANEISASGNNQIPSTSNDDPVPMDLEETLSNMDYAEEPQKTDVDGQHIKADNQIASSHSISLAPEKEVLCTSMLEVALHLGTVADAQAIVLKADAEPEVNKIPSAQKDNTADGQQWAEAISLNVVEMPTFSQISLQLKVIDNGDAEFSFLIQDKTPFLTLNNVKEKQEGGSHEPEGKNVIFTVTDLKNYYCSIREGCDGWRLCATATRERHGWNTITNPWESTIKATTEAIIKFSILKANVNTQKNFKSKVQGVRRASGVNRKKASLYLAVSFAPCLLVDVEWCLWIIRCLMI